MRRRRRSHGRAAGCPSLPAPGAGLEAPDCRKALRPPPNPRLRRTLSRADPQAGSSGSSPRRSGSCCGLPGAPRLLNFEPERHPPRSVCPHSSTRRCLEHIGAAPPSAPSVVVLTLTTFVSFVFAGRILDWLAGPVEVSRPCGPSRSPSPSAPSCVSLLSIALAFPICAWSCSSSNRLEITSGSSCLSSPPPPICCGRPAFTYVVLLPARTGSLSFLGIETCHGHQLHRFVTG
jgi:hypothetical protein